MRLMFVQCADWLKRAKTKEESVTMQAQPVGIMKKEPIPGIQIRSYRGSTTVLAIEHQVHETGSGLSQSLLHRVFQFSKGV